MALSEKCRLQEAERTRSLRGFGVLVLNPLTNRKYPSLLDMAGLVAEMSRYGKMKHVSIAPTISEGTEKRDFEDPVKVAGLKTAVPNVAQMVGVNRILRGQSITCVVGNSVLTREQEKTLRRKYVLRALEILQTDVEAPTILALEGTQ